MVVITIAISITMVVSVAIMMMVVVVICVISMTHHRPSVHRPSVNYYRGGGAIAGASIPHHYSWSAAGPALGRCIYCCANYHY